MRRRFWYLALAFGLTEVVAPSPAAAQSIVRDYNVAARRQEQLGEDHWLLVGDVELQGRDSSVFAEQVEAFTNEDRVILRGNVVVTQGENRIAADHAEFNTKTELGTFYEAYGIATLRPPRQTSSGGFNAPQLTGQDTDVYFFGKVVQKTGAQKYKMSDGGFSTCVQPTPRWDLHAETITLEIDDYTLLRNAILRVKGVPLLYVPLLYYPTKEDDRATGFLLPTYGVSSIQGQSISNGFFWAINRSHDATIEHDWFSKTGHGVGSEYRYNLGSGDGNLRTYLLNQQAATYVLPGGRTTFTPAGRQYELRGGLNQSVSRTFRARAYVDYFSSVSTSQLFHTNIYDASRSQRRYGGNLVGTWRAFSLNTTYDRSEYFRDTTSSTVTGSTPRVSFSRSERPLFPRSPVYFSFGSEFVQLERQNRFLSGTVPIVLDTSLTRVDFSPQIRYPFKKWQWFTVSTALTWRDTFYTRSDADPTSSVSLSDANVNRRFFTMSAQAVGPVLVRVFDTPESGYAERLKHSIEPYLNVQRTSSIDNYNHIIYTEGIDGIVGNTTNLNYGLRNRFYAKRRTDGRTGQSQEILSVDITQTYYTDERQAQFDRDYGSSLLGAPPSHFSPVRLTSRLSPATSFNASVGAEFDGRYREFRSVTASSSYNWSNRVQSSVGWSKRFFIEELPGYNNPESLGHDLNASTNVRTRDNRYGTVYDFNYNFRDSRLVRQSITAFYNAQCCGIAMQYHRFNYGNSSNVPADNRFFLSFTLAGLGNFSPFNGALGGIPR
jgi:LPS-assembly protein